MNAAIFRTAAEAADWCYNTTCPTDLDDVNEDTCCIWHVNVHSCPITTELAYCGPWIQPSGSVYTHSAVMWGAVSILYSVQTHSSPVMQ